MRLFDTHAHLLDEQFDADREAILLQLPAQGVVHVMEACCDEAEIDRVTALVARVPYLFGSAGVHPHSADAWNAASADHIARALQAPRMLAIGEIGLDYHYDFSPRTVQKACFDAQLGLAQQLGVPVIIHDREAHGDCMELLRLHRDGLKGVMHCFSGSYETGRDCVDLGLYIAFGGALTFKNATKQRCIAEKLPLERIVIETDCPYMTPEPHRGERNDPRLMHLTLETLANVRGISAEEAAQATFENALRLYGIELSD